MRKASTVMAAIGLALGAVQARAVHFEKVDPTGAAFEFQLFVSGGVTDCGDSGTTDSDMDKCRRSSGVAGYEASLTPGEVIVGGWSLAVVQSNRKATSDVTYRVRVVADAGDVPGEVFDAYVYSKAYVDAGLQPHVKHRIVAIPGTGGSNLFTLVTYDTSTVGPDGWARVAVPVQVMAGEEYELLSETYAATNSATNIETNTADGRLCLSFSPIACADPSIATPVPAMGTIGLVLLSAALVTGGLWMAARQREALRS